MFTVIFKDHRMREEVYSLTKLEEKARTLGFCWPDLKAIVEHAQSECLEIQDAYDQREGALRLQEEVGDLFHCCFSLCHFLGFEVTQTLELTTEKFRKRLGALEQLARERGFSASSGHSAEEWMGLWQSVKEKP